MHDDLDTFGLPIVHQYRTPLQLTNLALILGCLASVFMLLQDPGLGMLTFIFGCIGILPLRFIFGSKNRRTNELVAELRAGDHSLAWEVSAEEYGKFLAHNLKETLKRAAGFSTLLCLATVGMIMWEGGLGSSFFTVLGIGFGAGLGVFIIVSIVATYIRFTLSRWPGEVLVGEKGLYRTGRVVIFSDGFRG